MGIRLNRFHRVLSLGFIAVGTFFPSLAFASTQCVSQGTLRSVCAVSIVTLEKKASRCRGTALNPYYWLDYDANNQPNCAKIGGTPWSSTQKDNLKPNDLAGLSSSSNGSPGKATQGIGSKKPSQSSPNSTLKNRGRMPASARTNSFDSSNSSQRDNSSADSTNKTQANQSGNQGQGLEREENAQVAANPPENDNQRDSGQTQNNGQDPDVAKGIDADPARPDAVTSSNGQTPYDEKRLAEQEAAKRQYAGDLARNKYERNRDAVTKITDPDEPCATGREINAKFSCKDTQMIVEGAQIANVVGQAAGSMATQFQGMNAQSQAASSGTQSAALEGAADTQQSAGEMQVALGAVNAALGVYQIMKSKEHKKYNGEIHQATLGAKVEGIKQEGGVRIGDGTEEGTDGYVQAKTTSKGKAQTSNAETVALTNEILKNEAFNLQQPETDGGLITQNVTAQDPFLRAAENDARNKQIKAKERDVKKNLDSIGRAATGEQTSMQKQAMGSGVNSLVTGAQQLLSGFFNMKAADQLKQAAANMKNIEGQQNPAFAPPPFNPGADSFAPRQPTVISGTGQNPDASAAATEETQQDVADLGPPINPGGIPGGIQGTPPIPGALGKNEASPQGGSPASLPGGGTPAASSSGDGEAAPKMVDNRGLEKYESGGAYSGSMGGGGDKGPDLSGMLAQFLPKKEESMGRNSILDYGRGPAGEQPISLLDRNTDIFMRIHESYQLQHRRGRLGGI